MNDTVEETADIAACRARSPLRSSPAGPLCGMVRAPGDKSISHRALILAAMAQGVSVIDGLLDGEDVLRTAAALRALGASIERNGERWTVTGARWSAPAKTLYLGNSGTGARLLMGAVVGAGVAASFDGDRSLRGRPMGRVLEPLRMMGAEAADCDGRLPVSVQAAASLGGVDCRLAAPSAQVKSAILLAALGAAGVTRIHEPVLCRDHTERMLAVFGVDLETHPDGENGRFISIDGGQILNAANVCVPGDPSSAAFPIAAALITPGSQITVQNVLMNPLRTGFLAALRQMGADISVADLRQKNGEDVADVTARHCVLHGAEIAAELAPSMIDEYPILAVIAAFAHGSTTMRGLEELRLKESDRIAAIESGLIANGVDVDSGENWLRVSGAQTVDGGARVATHHDHRIAMSFLILGLAAKEPVEIDDAAIIATSFPDFLETMQSLGAQLSAPIH